MRKLLLIGVAGAFGAISRTLLGLFIQTPFATLIVNLVGTFLLCFLVAGVINKWSLDKHIQDAMMTGFLGSFTTFSALSIETVLLFEAGHFLLGVLYVGASLVGGVLVGFLGFYFGRKQVGI